MLTTCYLFRKEASLKRFEICTYLGYHNKSPGIRVGLLLSLLNIVEGYLLGCTTNLASSSWSGHGSRYGLYFVEQNWDFTSVWFATFTNLCRNCTSGLVVIIVVHRVQEDNPGKVNEMGSFILHGVHSSITMKASRDKASSLGLAWSFRPSPQWLISEVCGISRNRILLVKFRGVTKSKGFKKLITRVTLWNLTGKKLNERQPCYSFIFLHCSVITASL